MKQYVVYKIVVGIRVKNMPVSPLAIFRNPESAHVCIEISKLFQVTKSRKDDENTVKSAKFALFGSVVTEV